MHTPKRYFIKFRISTMDKIRHQKGTCDHAPSEKHTANRTTEKQNFIGNKRIHTEKYTAQICWMPTKATTYRHGRDIQIRIYAEAGADTRRCDSRRLCAYSPNSVHIKSHKNKFPIAVKRFIVICIKIPIPNIEVFFWKPLLN